MKIGLYFGTFDPVHNGHIAVAKQAFLQKLVDEIWFILTPTSPFKQGTIIASKENRLKMLQIALANTGFPAHASDVEFDLPYPQYTSKSLEHIVKLYPDFIFSLIMGSDSYFSLPKWHNANFIINNFQVYVYARQNNKIDKISPKTTFLSGKKINISSSNIRISFSREFINYSMLDHNVLEFIKKNQVY